VGAYVRKRSLAAAVVALKLPLTANIVIHRANIERVDQLVKHGARHGGRRGSRSPMYSITGGR